MLSRSLMARGPKHVLMTADAVGGIWTYALDLGQALRSRGIAVTLAVLGPGLDEAGREAARRAGLTLVELGHGPEWLADGPDEVLRATAALAALAEACAADLIHLNHPALGSQGFDAPMLAVCHSCVATWWMAVRQGPLPADFAWRTALVGAGYRAAAGLIAPSQAFAQATRAAYGLDRAPAVVHNGRVAPAPPAGPAREPVDRALLAGRLWDEGKDVATADRAAALTGVPVRAAGPLRGPNGAGVALLHIEALGSVPEVRIRALLAERPVFVSTARYEPFGLAVLEAAQAGCALVLTDIPTFRELWDEAAVFVRPGDAAALAAVLDRLVAEPAERSRLAAAATERASHYAMERHLASVMDFYRTLPGLAA